MFKFEIVIRKFNQAWEFSNRNPVPIFLSVCIRTNGYSDDNLAISVFDVNVLRSYSLSVAE